MQENIFEDVNWLHGILEFSSAGLWKIITDNNTGISGMYASQSMLKLLGLQTRIPPEDCYKHWWNNIEDEFKDYVLHAVGQMIATGEQKEVQYVWNHPEYGKIFVRCSGKVEKNENGVCEIRGCHQNITEIDMIKSEMSVEERKIADKINKLKSETKRLDEQTHAWRGLLRKVLENTNTFESYYYPKERRKVYPKEVWKKYHWNRQYENMPYSFSKEYIEEEYQEVYETMYESIHKGEDTASCEVALKGKKQWFRASLSVIEHDELGNPAFVVGMIEDITEEKISQLEKKQLQMISNFTINHDYECLAMIDVETRQYAVHYSENWEKQYFSTLDDIKDNAREQVKGVIHENDISKFTIKHIIDNLNKEKESEYIIFYRSVNNIHKEARCYWFEKNKKLLITVRNIEKNWKREQESKQKIMEALEVAKEANRAKSDFLSRMSHDIRTPLNAIMGMTAIAKKYSNDTEKIEKCLDSISNSSNYLTLLINDVLDMAKIENNKLKLNEESFALDEVIPKMLHIINPLIDSKKHQMIVTYGELKHRWVKGDVVRLQQILLNILSNAVKYTNPNGKIEFDMKELSSDKKEYGCYQFHIKDNGIGMDEVFLSRLFNPFERKDNERVGNIEGTGLGMAIAKSIATMMEGDITVTSKENQGSDFTLTVYLKLLEEEQKRINEDSEEKQIPYFKGKNILLVEDNIINLEIAEEILSTTEANVETAENGKEAIERIQHSKEGYYNMIFMDVRMPIMNGYEAVEVIRNLERQDVKTVPIIAMTADAFAEDVKKAKDCGMNEHIAKPIDIDKLYEIMRKYN